MQMSEKRSLFSTSIDQGGQFAKGRIFGFYLWKSTEDKEVASQVVPFVGIKNWKAFLEGTIRSS
jgi:hypothetical protein